MKSEANLTAGLASWVLHKKDFYRVTNVVWDTDYVDL